jgi:hypothetical protein
MQVTPRAATRLLRRRAARAQQAIRRIGVLMGGAETDLECSPPRTTVSALRPEAWRATLFR